jgi:hypothetical protein
VTIEEALRTALAADATLTAITSSRIYPVVAPQGTAAAYVTYEKVTGNPHHDHGGSGNLRWARISYMCHAPTYSQAKAMAAAIRTLLDGYRGTLSGVSIGSILSEEDADIGLDDQTRMQLVAVDFMVQYYV